MGRKFKYKGDEWEINYTGISSGGGTGHPFPEYQMSFRCVTDPSKGPYNGHLLTIDPNQCSDDDLQRSLKRAMIAHPR